LPLQPQLGSLFDIRYYASNESTTAKESKNLVFLHGYNVNQQEARGVESEVFKRFYWSGARVKFYGVTWNGAVSKDAAGGYSLQIIIPMLLMPY
jgi:hypothetical protein